MRFLFSFQEKKQILDLINFFCYLMPDLKLTKGLVMSRIIAMLSFSIFCLSLTQTVNAYEPESQLYQVAEDFHAGKYQFIEMDIEKLDQQTKQRLEAIALKETEVWVDTILEGGYQLGQNDLSLDRLQAITDARGATKAFRLKFSQQAYYTEECLANVDYPDFKNDKERIEFLNQMECSEGRISTYIMISTDFKDHERDPEEYEEFDN